MRAYALGSAGTLKSHGRDYEDRLIYRSGAWSALTSVRERLLAMLSTIERCGFFNDHVLPQARYLDAPPVGHSSCGAECQRACRWPWDVIAPLERSAAARTRLVHQLQLAFPTAAIDAATLLNATRTIHARDSEGRDVRPKFGTPQMFKYSNTAGLDAATCANVTRRVCRMYREDFCLFGFTRPAECAGVDFGCQLR